MTLTLMNELEDVADEEDAENGEVERMKKMVDGWQLTQYKGGEDLGVDRTMGEEGWGEGWARSRSSPVGPVGTTPGAPAPRWAPQGWPGALIPSPGAGPGPSSEGGRWLDPGLGHQVEGDQEQPRD